MDTPEAAASLFGPEDSSSDPFAVIGGDSAHIDIPPFPHDNAVLLDETPYGEPFDHHQPGHSGNDAYASYSEPLTCDSATSVAQQTSAYEPTSSFESSATYSSSYDVGTPSLSQQAATQYNLSSYLPPTSQPANAWNAPPASAVDRYAPVAPSAGASSYDSYSHYSQPQYSSYAAPAYPAPPPPQVAIPAQPTIPAPAPPVVPKPLDRPKVSNAYDPPFPTAKSRRPGRTASSHQAYGNYSTYQTPVAPTLPSAARATPPPPKVSAYSNNRPTAPTAYSHGAQHASHSPPSQPPLQNEYTSPYTVQLPSNVGQPLSHPNESQVRSPPATVTDIPQWSSDRHTSEDVGLDPPQNRSGQNDFYSNLPTEATNGPPRSFVSPPNDVSSINGSAQDGSLNKPSSPVKVATQPSSYSSFSVPHNTYQAHNPGTLESRRTVYQSPKTGVSDPYAPSWSSSGINAHRPPLHQAYASPQQAYTHPQQDYLAPQQDYSPPSQWNDSVQRDKPASALDQSTYGGSHASSVTMPLSHGYEPSSNPASESAQFKRATSPSSTSLHVSSMVYAPSPSLLGSNDPLARTTARAPVINFGFGGRLVTCFHGAATLSTGFDVALSNRNATSVKVQTLQKLLPKSVFEHSEVIYPGPLFPDLGNASIALVRSGASSQAKGKKRRVIKYLEDRASEITQGLAYQGPQEREQFEAKLVLTNLLKVLVENDGQILGSPQSEVGARAALVPHIATSAIDGQTSAGLISPTLYSISPADSLDPISVTTLTSASLTKIEELLMRGERRQAYTYALDQKLWAHAMVIASSIDKEAWKEVVNDFIHTELATKESATHSTNQAPAAPHHSLTTSKRESLRVAYSLYSGQGAAAVKELVPTKLISLASGLQHPNMMAPAPTPRTPAFPPTMFASSPPASLAQWRETAAMMISSPLSQDASSALTALGDQLMSYGWVEAAHACYLLSPQTSPVGGAATPAVRIVMLGCRAPQLSPLFSKDLDVFIFSEILEFALALAPVAKGLEPFNGIPHLQAYRLVRASSLAEIGDIQLANRYCEAISTCLSKGSPYFNPTFISQLKILTERINGVAHSEKSSWIGGKISKPSLDTIGGWLDRRFTKLVTGDGDGESPEEETKTATERTFDGPFTHYSTISTTPSARSSPQPAHNQYAPPPQRTSSAMAVSSYHPAQPLDRASSATGHHRENQAGQPYGAAPFAYGNNPNHSSPVPALNTTSQQPSTETKSSSDGEPETPVQQGSSWWDYSSGGTAQTPTAAAFMTVEDPVVSESTNGFISLMDNQQFGFQPKSASAPPARERPQDMGGDEEDLGFGNRKPSARPSPVEQTREAGSAAQPAPASAPVSKSNSSSQQLGEQPPTGGWLTRWWKGGSEPTSGPVKVKLGEENSFYYDKEQKRWVNRKAGSEEVASTPPPPPPRAATASPSKAAFRPPTSNSAPPPARANSAMDFSSPAENSGSRVRSNLVPPSEGSTPLGGSRPPSAAPGQGPPPSSRPPSTAPTSQGPTPPASRPRSQATKRNIRSRYVDVFQQENAGQ